MIRRWLLLARNVVIALAIIAVGEALPPLQALEAWMAPRRASLVWGVGGVAFVGWALFMGATLYRIFTGGGSLTRAQIDEQLGRVKSYQRAPMAVARSWRYRAPKRAWGAGFSDEMSVAQFKAAWRNRLWRHDSRWRGVFVMGFGAAIMSMGICGLIVVLGTPGLKFLMGGAFLYAAVRTTWVLWKA